MLNNLESLIEEGKFDDTNDDMKRITVESTKVHKSCAKLWVSEIISEKETKEVSDDEEEDEEDGDDIFGL